MQSQYKWIKQIMLFIYLFILLISEKILGSLLFIMGGLPRNNLILVCLAYLECELWEEGVPKK